MSTSSQRKSTRTPSMDKTTLDTTMSDSPSPPLHHLLLRQNDALTARLRSNVPLAGIQEVVDLLHLPAVESSTPSIQASTLASTSTLSRQSTSSRCFTPSTTCIGTGSDHTWRGPNIEDESTETDAATAPSDMDTQSNAFAGLGEWTQGLRDSHLETELDEDVSTTKTARPCINVDGPTARPANRQE